MSEQEESSNSRTQRLMMETMMKQMKEWMNIAIDGKLAANNQHIPTSTSGPILTTQGRDNRRKEKQPLEQPREQTGPIRSEADDNYYGSPSHSSQGRPRPPRRTTREARDPLQENLGGFKAKIPPFYGKNDPDAYLEWEQKIELAFNIHQYTEFNRVRVATTEFYEYALSWWDQLVTTRRRNGEHPIDTWAELKRIMKKGLYRLTTTENYTFG